MVHRCQTLHKNRIYPYIYIILLQGEGQNFIISHMTDIAHFYRILNILSDT